jgi:hypothetical protein
MLRHGIPAMVLQHGARLADEQTRMLHLLMQACVGSHAVRGIPSLKAAAKSFPRRVEAALER